MRTHQRSLRERLGRGFFIVLGLLGGLALVDAVLMFLVLLLAAIFIDVPAPYVGLLMFIVLPLVAVIGGALAWTGYSVLIDRAPEPEDRPTGFTESAPDSHHVHV